MCIIMTLNKCDINLKSTTTDLRQQSKVIKPKQQRKSLKRCLKKLNELRKIYYIEFLILLFNLAQGLRASANFPSFYFKVCNELYSSSTTPFVCSQLKNNKTVENIVQKETARWLMYNEIVAFLPNLITAMFFGSFGDKYGRKTPTLIAISSMVIHNFLYMLFVSMPLFPIYSLTVEACVIAFGGTKTVFISAQYAEAAHQTKDKSKLTLRFCILTGCISCAIFVAGNASPFLLTFCSLEWIMVVGQIVMTAAFMFAVVFHSPSTEKKTKKTEPTPVRKKGMERRLTSVEIFCKTIAPRRKSHSVKPQLVWYKRMLHLYQSAWKTLVKKRANHGRIHLFLFCFIGLIYSCADSGMDTVTTLYVYHAPLSWTPSIFSRWMGTMSIVQLIGGIGGTYLLKRFNFSDFTVLLVGLTSAVAKMVCTSLATTTWIMYLSLCLGCVSNIGISSLRSLVIGIGSESEINELTSMMAIVMGWAQLCGSLVCNNIYTATVHFYAGFTFATVAVLLMVCFLITLGMFYHAKRTAELPTSRRNSSAVFYVDTTSTTV